MSFSRFLKKVLIPGYNEIDTIKKISEYGIENGIKEKIKQDFFEDMPLVSDVYKIGKDSGIYEGEKIGVEKTSAEYDKKFLKQAEEFSKIKQELISSNDEKDNLLDKYEKYIVENEMK